MTIYYTYLSYETDKGDPGLLYIGCRKCPEGKTPWTDNYFGSPKSKRNLDFKENPNKGKRILGIFDSKEEALAHEIWLHNLFDVARDPKFANQAKQTSAKFSTAGVKFSPEFCQQMSERMKGEKNPNFDHTPYNFKNKELGIIEIQVTKNYLIGKYELNSSNISGVVKGRRGHHKGWTLLTS